MRPQVGQVINNKYRLVRIIGDGGMGSVYEARHEVLGTTVALKFLHPELSRRAGLVQRFLQEARVSAAIQSPHVVRVSDVDQMQSGQAFIVMEYLEGKTLQTLYEELYNAGQRLSYNDALEYACQMIDGVEAAHRSGVVHRDLKPDNVMLTIGSRGEPLLKLLDFGIAKLKVTGELDRGLTRPGVIMGTPEYMAPEQAYSADTVDVRADIFSLGVMIFEMLAGRRPVGGDEPQQIASSYLEGQIAQLSDLAPHVPPDLAKVIHHAMGAKPSDRYDTLADFRAALQPFAAAAHAPSAGPATTTPAPSSVVANNNFTTVPPTGPVGPIPKTLPPNDEDPPPGVAGVVGPVGTPPQATPPSQIATPFGGFAANTPAGSGTSIGAPLQQMSQDGTTPAPPLPAAFESNQRAGGTAIGSSLSGNSSGYNTPQGGYGQPPVHAQAQGWQPQGGYPQQTPGYGQTPGYVPTQGQPTNTQRGGGAGIIVMLLIALIVTGVVMGGVYLSQKLNNGTENGSATGIPTIPPPTTVLAETPTAKQTQTNGPLAVPTMYTPPPPQQTQTPTPTGPSKPPPTGTATSPQPSASSTATSAPTFPPFSLPSGFPTSLPTTIPTFFPTSAPTNTSRPPTTTTAPTSTAPTTTTTTTRPRIIIPIPRRSPRCRETSTPSKERARYMNDQQGGAPPTNPYGPGKTIVGEPLYPPDGAVGIPPQQAFPSPQAGAPVPQTIVEQGGPPAGLSPGTGTQPGGPPAAAGPYPGAAVPYGSPGQTAPYGTPGQTAPQGYGAPQQRSAPYPGGQPYQQAFQPPPLQPARSSGGGMGAIIAVVGLLGLLLVGGVTVAFFSFRKTEPEEIPIVPVAAPSSVSVAEDPAPAATPANPPAELPVATVPTPVTTPAPAQPTHATPKPTTTTPPAPVPPPVPPPPPPTATTPPPRPTIKGFPPSPPAPAPAPTPTTKRSIPIGH